MTIDTLTVSPGVSRDTEAGRCSFNGEHVPPVSPWWGDGRAVRSVGRQGGVGAAPDDAQCGCRHAGALPPDQCAPVPRQGDFLPVGWRRVQRGWSDERI